MTLQNKLVLSIIFNTFTSNKSCKTIISCHFSQLCFNASPLTKEAKPCSSDRDFTFLSAEHDGNIKTLSGKGQQRNGIKSSSDRVGEIDERILTDAVFADYMPIRI